MMKVLLIDDDMLIHVVVEATLKQAGGFDLRTAYSGEETFKILEKWRPDIILLDFMLEDAYGTDLLVKMRVAPDLGIGDIPVIFLTAKSKQEEIDSLLAEGVAGVITKPFDPTILAGQIIELAGYG